MADIKGEQRTAVRLYKPQNDLQKTQLATLHQQIQYTHEKHKFPERHNLKTAARTTEKNLDVFKENSSENSGSICLEQ